jgi:Cytidylate kinase-like family
VAARVICISHATGGEGERVGRLVAERLGFRYLDEEIVAAVAEREELDPEVVADVERRKSLVARFLESLADAGAAEAYGGVVAGPVPVAAGDDLRTVINAVVRETANQGDVVIASHAASIALAGETGVLRVLVTASPETRARRLAATGMSEAEAEKAVSSADAARADYLRRFHRVREELPTHYDLVVNTDVLSPDDAAVLVLRAAEL